MRPYCGKKMKYLTKDEIREFDCNKTSWQRNRIKCKEKLKGIRHNYPCKYFILRR